MEFTLKRCNASAVVRTLGGELISYRVEGQPEYIWQGDPAAWSGQNPILFPIVGRLGESGVRFGGEETYHMPQHGLARQREFTLAEQGEDYVVLEQRDDPETLAAYPFPYLLRVRSELVAGGFATTITVVNTGSRDMPFCLGAHTGLCCPRQEGERFEDYVLVFDEAEDLPALIPTGENLLSRENTMAVLQGGNTIPLSYPLFDAAGTLVFDGLRSHGVSLRHRETGRGVHMDFSGFPMLALWTPASKEAAFLCVEPWQGCAALVDESGQFADKPHAVLLRPGEAWRAGYTVTTL